MVNYENSVIYKIVSRDPSIKNNYIGSTTDFRKIKINHKSNCNNKNSKFYRRYVYRFIRKNGGWRNWKIAVVKKYPDIEDKMELLKKHRKWMRVLDASLNKRVPGTVLKVGKRKYDKMYYQLHREKNVEYYRQYNEYYRQTHYIQIRTKARKQVECECGCIVKQCSIAYHIKSQKHIELMNDK